MGRTQALAFLSSGITTELALEDSYARALEFGAKHKLGKPVPVYRATYGFAEATRLPEKVLTAAAKAGARLVESDAKVRDDGTPFSDNPGVAKVKANEYRSVKPLKEGEWIDVSNAIPAVRYEMVGSRPKGTPVEGSIAAGKYFVLGLESTTEGGQVATLGRVSKLAELGQGKGKYVYNVDAASVSEGRGEKPTEMKVDNGGKVEKIKGTTAPKSTTGDTGKVTKESKKTEQKRLTAEDAHGTGIRVWQRLNEMRGSVDTRNVTVVTETKKETAPTPESKKAPAKKNAAKAMQEAHAAIDSNVEDAVDLQYEMMSSNFAMRAESIPMSIQGVKALSGPTSEIGDDPRSLVPDNEPNLLKVKITQMQKSKEEQDEVTDDADTFTAAEEPSDEEEVKAEDLLPGDVSTEGGLLSALKSRGYANPEEIAAKLREGSPAQEWYNLTGNGLEDAKRLQWAYMQVTSGQA